LLKKSTKAIKTQMKKKNSSSWMRNSRTMDKDKIIQSLTQAASGFQAEGIISCKNQDS